MCADIKKKTECDMHVDLLSLVHKTSVVCVPEVDYYVLTYAHDNADACIKLSRWTASLGVTPALCIFFRAASRQVSCSC